MTAAMTRQESVRRGLVTTLLGLILALGFLLVTGSHSGVAVGQASGPVGGASTPVEQTTTTMQTSAPTSLGGASSSTIPAVGGDPLPITGSSATESAIVGLLLLAAGLLLVALVWELRPRVRRL